MIGYEMEAQEFWAPSVSQAMKQIALELGDDAMILSTEEQPHPLNPSEKVYCVVASIGAPSQPVQEPIASADSEPAPERPATIPGEQMEVFHALLLQLKDVKAELNELRAAQTEWEKTTVLCRELRREVRALAAQVTGREAPESGTASNGSNPEDVVPSVQVEIPVVPPLWEEESPGVVFLGGSRDSGKSEAVARIALACEQRGQSVAMIDLTGSGALEAYGKQIGVPVWNVPQEGSMSQILSACSSLDLILIGGLDEKESEAKEISQAAGLGFRSLRVLAATESAMDVRKQLQLATELTSIVVTGVDACNNMSGLLAELRISGYPVSHVCEGSEISGGVRAARSGEMKLDTRAA